MRSVSRRNSARTRNAPPHLGSQHARSTPVAAPSARRRAADALPERLHFFDDDSGDEALDPIDLDAIDIDGETDAEEPVSDWLEDRELAIAIARGGLH